MSINQRIKDWAINNNLRQVDLVNTAKISKSVASRIFNDQTYPSLETISKLANTYDLDLNYIIKGYTVLPKNEYIKPKTRLQRLIDYVLSR